MLYPYQGCSMPNNITKHIILSITIIILLLLSCDRQDRITDSSSFLTWETVVGGTEIDEGYSIISTFDDGCIVAGTTESFGSGEGDIYIIRLNRGGDTLWTKTYGADQDDRGRAITHTPNGGYIVAGDIPSFGASAYDMFLIRIDSKGDMMWYKTYGGSGNETAYSIETLPDGNSLIAGFTSSFGSRHGIYTLKINQFGDILWSNVFWGDAIIYYRVAMTSINGGLYITGSYMLQEDSGAHNDVFVIKTNSEGDSLFTKFIGGTKDDMGYSIVTTPDGGCIVAGTTRSFGAGGLDVYLIRLNSSGDIIWTKTFGNQGADIANSIISSSDGSFVIAGYSESFAGADKNVLLMKIDIDGNLVWARSLDSFPVMDFAYSVTQAIDGGYILTGYRSLSKNKYVYIIKTDPNGDL